MKHPVLLEVEPVGPSAKVLLNAFKKRHHILTHCASHQDDTRWLAVLPFTGEEGRDIFELMADKCRLYDEAGHTGYGRGELSAVRDLCKNAGLLCEI